jgi:hypothetical protein
MLTKNEETVFQTNPSQSESVLEACENCKLAGASAIRDLIVEKMVLNLNHAIDEIEALLYNCGGESIPSLS